MYNNIKGLFDSKFNDTPPYICLFSYKVLATYAHAVKNLTFIIIIQCKSAAYRK